MARARLGKDVKLFISIAERPTNFGCTIHNVAFKALGLGAVYLPRKVTASELKSAVEAIRGLTIGGCGVSMPHKIEIMKYLDDIDPTAKRIGAVNTVVNSEGVLKGFNTDYLGALQTLKENYDVKGKHAYVIGTGGVARVLILALKELGAKEVFVMGRNDQSAKHLAKEFQVESLEWSRLNEIQGDILINATPVGMNSSTDCIVNGNVIGKFRATMDVVVIPLETKMIATARKLGLTAIPGHTMALYQAAEQFKLYTHQTPPLDVMKRSIEELAKDNSRDTENGIMIRSGDEIKSVNKPWGYEKWITGEIGNLLYAFKKIFLKKGFKTSLQYHERKTETNFVHSGKIRLYYQTKPFVKGEKLNIETKDFGAGTNIQVYPYFIHRIEALEDTVLFEASTSELDDVIRLEDDAKRGSGRIISEHKK